jgi:hypothetical protein
VSDRTEFRRSSTRFCDEKQPLRNPIDAMPLTQRRFVYLALATIAGGSVLVLYIGYVSWSPINREAVARIQRGMTEAQVEKILGGPCTETVMLGQLTRRDSGDPLQKAGSMKTWQGGQAGCTVIFDSAGCVIGAFFHDTTDPGLLDRMRAALGLGP